VYGASYYLGLLCSCSYSTVCRNRGLLVLAESDEEVDADRLRLGLPACGTAKEAFGIVVSADPIITFRWFS
jgi:hypothetical protein